MSRLGLSLIGPCRLNSIPGRGVTLLAKTTLLNPTSHPLRAHWVVSLSLPKRTFHHSTKLLSSPPQEPPPPLPQNETPSPQKPENPPPPAPTSTVQKITGFISTYGPLGVGVYFTIWSSFMVAFYFILSTGILGIDAVGILESVGLQDWVNMKNVPPLYSNLILAFALNKTIEVFRIPMAIATTAWLRRYLDARKKSN
eukprot:TRINITY_DN7175_c0_g1_i1.p1 TRINITY_DN7175_c0_g1~~TRINITY_DN7175_c0_g1_i1.p1  ORF type:complete len:198 (+),score=30.08 TRINITY_DN7175_c0_g1_i1:97-690(+)